MVRANFGGQRDEPLNFGIKFSGHVLFGVKNGSRPWQGKQRGDEEEVKEEGEVNMEGLRSKRHDEGGGEDGQ